MKLLNFFKSKAKDAVNSLAGISLVSNISFSQNINGLRYYKNWVYTATKARGKSVSMINFRLIKNGEDIEKHDILSMLEDLDFEVIQTFLDLTGNAYIYVARDNNGKGNPAKLFPVSPGLMRPVINKANPMEIAYYEAGKIQFPTSDIIHFKNFNPNAPYPLAHLGASVLSAISNTVEIDEASRKWNFGFFQNSARPDGLLTTDQDLTEEDIERIQEDFIAKYGGVDNAHKIGFLGGGMKFVALSSSQKDIDFVEQNRMSRDEILSAFGVPKSEVGIVEDVNRANAEASHYVFMKNTVDPLMRQIALTLQKEFLDRFYQMEDLKLSYWTPIPRDETAKLAYYAQAVDKWLTRNEIRREEGYPEINGADGLFNTLANVEIAVDTQKTIREAQRKEEIPDFAGLSKVLGEAIETMEKGEISVSVKEEGEAPEVKKKAFRHLTPEARASHVKSWNNIFKAKEDSFVKDLQKYFKKQEGKILDLLSKAEKGFDINIISAFFKGKEWEKEISVGVSMITPKIMEYILSGAENANSTIGNDTPLEVNARVNNFIKERATFFSESVNDTTKQTLLEAITGGSSEGLSNAEIVDKVKEIYIGISDARAKMIARTEISASANFGSVEQYLQAGVKYHEWAVVNPEDEDCLMNEGEVVKIGEAFRSGDVNSPIHPNCQCTTLAVFE